MQLERLTHGAGRVVLRRLAIADLADFQAYRHDVEVGRYQGWGPQTDQEAARFIEAMSRAPVFPQGAWIQFGIAERLTDRLIGDAGVHVSGDAHEAEIGFTLARQAQGRGIGSDAVVALIELIFAQTEVDSIVARTDERNAAANRLLRRLGFHRVESVDAVFRGEACVEYLWAMRRP